MPLIDTFGRVHRDLRISVTDRCNFRCTYCMPADGLDWLPREDLLTFEEIERLAALMVNRFGIDSIRLTGGEPTVRANLPILVEKLAALGVDLALTTNGATLGLLADKLVAAGLRRINISLDSLQPDRFERLTRRNDLDRVLDGIDAAVAAGLDPVKINAVMMRGVNDDEVVDFARFGREKGVEVRFIEFMPLDADLSWSNDKVVTLDEIVSTWRGIPAGPCRALALAGRGVALRRRPGLVRGDRQRDRRLLRKLRSGAAHRRGHVPQLLVRGGRTRPPGAAALRSERR